MRSYFHCSTVKFRRRRSVVLVLTGAVCAEAAVTAFIVMFFGLFGTEGVRSDDLTRDMLIIAAAFVVAGLAVCFISSAAADRKAARHSRYTYLDIQLKAAVISVYSGEMTILGKNAVFRELYLIPFRDFGSAAPSADGKKLVIRGKLRRYGMESDFLGYHVRGGDIEFDRMWLNVGSYRELDEAEFPPYFGSPARIGAALSEAKKRFDELPKPKKHEFHEAAFIRRRPIRRLLPDDPDFSRTWK